MPMGFGLDDILDKSVSMRTATKSYTTKSVRSNGPRKPRKHSQVVEVAMEPQVPAFTQEMVLEGLSQLGKTADGLRPVYLSLTVTGTDLSTVEPLATYIHVQTVDVHDNKLANIAGLGALKSLTKLDVSHNSLKEVLGLKLSGPDNNLRSADFSFNLVAEVADLSRFSRLQSLRLDGNAVELLGDGLRGLRMLRSLSIANNKLKNCQGMEELSSLRELNISDNRVTSLQALAPLSGLQSLTAARNVLVHLAGVQSLVSLRRLDLSDNLIPRLEEVTHVCGATLLSHLNLMGNPLDKAMSLRLHVVYLLPQMSHMDDMPVDAQDKVMAANMHGADAEPLRAARRKYFPNGELDDGGGAIPPMAAGLVASQAEEEATEDTASTFLRLGAWARSVKVAQGGLAGLVGLADQLASVCQGQLQCARVVYEWLAVHLVPPDVDTTWQVNVPLFGPFGVEAEKALLGPVTGTWAERASWLFVHLARACELEAVMIPGYWKHGRMLPGCSVVTHNHCWSSVKVNGRWRLVDCTAGAVAGGHAPFYLPPTAWIYSYFPLEAHWQLSEDPISLDDWWTLPHCSPEFFAKGCSVLDSQLQAVNVMSVPREGRPLPSVSIRVAAPNNLLGLSLSHTLLDSELQPVASWPPREDGPQTVFQQVEAGTRGNVEVAFGARRFGCSAHQIWTSLPGPGEWYIRVQVVTVVHGAMRLNIAGLAAPMELRILELDDSVMVKVVVPPVRLHNPLEGILADLSAPPMQLPYTHPTFTARRCQLVSPSPDQWLEADRVVEFAMVVPSGVERLGLVTSAGNVIVISGVDEVNMLTTSIVVPRSESLKIIMYSEHEGHHEATSEPLLTFPVRPQLQHMTVQPVDVSAPPIEPDSSPEARAAYELFKALDLDGDGLVTKQEMLVAFHRNRQHADNLKFPAKIIASDGTLARFHEHFLEIDRRKWGYFCFDELAAYMGVVPRPIESDDGSEEEEEEEEEEDEGEYDEEDEGEEGEEDMEGGMVDAVEGQDAPIVGGGGIVGRDTHTS